MIGTAQSDWRIATGWTGPSRLVPMPPSSLPYNEYQAYHGGKTESQTSISNFMKYGTSHASEIREGRGRVERTVDVGTYRKESVYEYLEQQASCAQVCTLVQVTADKL